jgi:hypothetical protein
MTNAPLNLTMNPKLDIALGEGWNAWETAAREAGIARTTSWAAQRAGEDVPRADLKEHIQALLETEDPDDAVFARAELAELIEGADDTLSHILWEGVIEFGIESDDPDLIFEATTHMAAIAETHEELQVAAEYYIEFLNWRRNPGVVSDPETVLTAFDEIIRLAEEDGEPKAAALFGFRQVAFAKLVESEAETAGEGDWEADGKRYESWS